MKQYVILTDASDNSTYGIVVKDGMTFSVHGAHRKAEEWAGWANSQEQKSLEQLLPPGITQSTASTLHNDSHLFIKGLLDVAISGASFVPGKRSYIESHRTNAWSATPSARDFQLSAFSIDGRQQAVAFKALAFKSDSNSYSFAALLRSGAVGFNPQTGLVRSRVEGASSRHLQAKVDASIPRSIQRHVGMDDIAHKSLIKNRDIVGGQIEVKKLGGRLGSRLGGGLRAAPAGFVFIDVTGRIDADKDGIVFESTPMERPIIPRFTVPENLGKKISSLLQGSSEENEKLRRAGRLGDADVSGVRSQIEQLLGADASQLSKLQSTRTSATRQPLSPERARAVIQRARQIGASRVGRGEKTQINTEGSRAVEKISWDDKAKELIVTFNGGRTYTYKDVDDKWVKELESNPDFLGRILNDIKKQGFQYERGGKHAPDKTLSSPAQRRRESVGLRSSSKGPDATTNLNRIYDRILDRTGYDTEFGSDKGPREVANIVHNRWKKATREERQDYIASEGNATDGAMALASDEGLLDDFDFSNPVDSMTPNQRLGMSSRSARRLSDKERGIQARAKITQLQEGDVLPENWDDDTKKLGNPAGFSIEEIRKDSYPGFYTITLKNSRDGTIQKRQFEEDDTFPNVGRPSTLKRGARGEGRGGLAAVRTLAMLPGEPPRDAQRDRPVFGTRSRRSYDDESGSRGIREGVAESEHFVGSMWIDQLKGDNVDADVIPLADIYGDDRPGYAVVGVYRTDDGFGGIEYFYGGDDEEFDSVEDAMDFLQNIEDQGNEGILYGDPEFRSLDRVRSAGKPGRRPLEGLRSRSGGTSVNVEADRRDAAHNSRTNIMSPNYLDELSRREDVQTRLNVANNDMAYLETIKDLLEDENLEVRKAADKNIQRRFGAIANQPSSDARKPASRQRRQAARKYLIKHEERMKKAGLRSSSNSNNWDNWANSIAPTITNNPEIRDLLSTRDMGVGNYIRVGNDIVTPRDLKDILGVPSTRSASPYSGPSVSGVSLPAWDDLNKMRRIPGPTGLNEGYWFEDDSTGRIFFAKRGRSDGHAEAEVAGAAVYRVAGAGVPHKAIIKNEAGETWVVSEKIDNLQNTSNPTGRIRAQAKQDMGIDMLLQVRDAWSGGSNKMVDPIGVIHTVDTGGAGPYRAQGGAKTPEFSPDAEWTDVATMIYMPGAPIRGQHISNLYGRVSNNDLVVAMRRVEHLNLQKIDQEMIDADVPPAMRKLFVDTIAARQKMAKTMADLFEGYEPSARVNVAGTDITPGGERVAPQATQGLMSSIFRFRPTDDGFKKDLFGPSTRSVVMTPVSRRDATKPRYSDTLDGEVVMRGKDSAGGFQAEIVLTPEGDYVIVGRERNARGQWETVGFGAGKQDDILDAADNIEGSFSSIDDAEARIRDYVDGPDEMDYDDAVEYLTGSALLSTRSSIADRNSGIKSARSASLAQRDGELRLARPADGFHYADFERMSDKQLLEEYFGALATRWESLSSSSGPSNNTEFQHIVSALRDRNMFGSVKELLNKYDMEYQSAVRRGVPFRIPDSEFGNDGSYGMPGKRPSLASLRSARSDNEEDSNVEISMTLLQLGDLSKDLHDIDDAIGAIDDELMSADAELGMPALYDALENAIGGVDSIVITREEFDAAKGTITGLQAMLKNGTLSKRYAASLGRLSNLIDQVDNSDGHFVTAQLTERGHMFDMPRPGQSDFIRKFGEIVSRAKAKGLLRGRNRSSYLNMEKEERIPTIGRFRMPEPAVIDGYKESDDYEDNFQRWARLTKITSAYAKEQGLGEGIAPSRSAYEGSPQFYNDVRSWDAIQVARMNSWQGFDGDDDGRGNLSLRSTRANLASTRSKRVKREGSTEPNAWPWLRRNRDTPEGPVVEGFLYSEESRDYFDTWLNMVNNFEGFAEEQGIDLSLGEPDFADYASSPQFLDDVQDWDYKAVRGTVSQLREIPVDSFDETGRPLMSNRSSRRSYESSDAFERGYNRFAMDANDIGFANEQEISLRRMPNRNDYRYSKAFNEDAAMYANGIEPGMGSGRGGRTSTRSGQFVNFTRPGSGNTNPRYSDTKRGEVVSRGRSSDGNARFEVIRDRDGSYSVSGQEKDERGKWVDVFSLDSDDEAQSGGLDNVFDSIEDAQEAINYYLTGPNSYDDFMGSIADQTPLLTRSTRSVSRSSEPGLGDDEIAGDMTLGEYGVLEDALDLVRRDGTFSDEENRALSSLSDALSNAIAANDMIVLSRDDFATAHSAIDKWMSDPNNLPGGFVSDLQGVLGDMDDADADGNIWTSLMLEEQGTRLSMEGSSARKLGRALRRPSTRSVSRSSEPGLGDDEIAGDMTIAEYGVLDDAVRLVNRTSDNLSDDEYRGIQALYSALANAAAANDMIVMNRDDFARAKRAVDKWMSDPENLPGGDVVDLQQVLGEMEIADADGNIFTSLTLEEQGTRLTIQPPSARTSGSAFRRPSNRSVSERKRIASIETGSSLRSSASTAIDGLKVPGARRIDEQDGRLWESLSPEQRGLVEARAIEIEENLIRGLSGPGNLRIDVNENGDIVSIEIDEPRKTTTINSIDAGSRVNEYIGLYGDVPDFNFWGSSSQKEVTGKNKRQQAKFDALEKYQLLSTERDPITGKWRVVLSPEGLRRLEETHGKVRELLLQKRDEIDADSKLSDGMKATKLKDINEKIKALDDQASALIVLASARVNAKDGRNEEGGNRFAFAPEQLPSSMRKELLSTPKTFGGAAAAKNKLFKKWAATQTGKSNKKLRANSKEYKDLKAKFDAGELPEVFAWYHKQDKDSSKSLAQLGLPEPEEFGWKRSAGNIDGIVGPNGKATPNYDDIIGDDPIVGDDVNLDFDHSSRLWSQDVLGIPDEDAAKVRGESFWRKLNLAKSVIPSPSEWINRHNERLRKRQERKNRLKRLKAGQASYGGRAEDADKTAKELRLLKKIKAKRLQALQAKKRAADEIYGAHDSKQQSKPAITIDENGNPVLSPETLARIGDIEILTKPPKQGDLSKEDKQDAKKREKLEKEIKAGNLEADRVLGTLWGINGYNERPTIVTEEEFIELAQDPGNTVIRRGHGGKTFAERHLDDPERHTTGDGGTLQGPGEYWAVRKEGGEMQPDSSWRGYVNADAQRGKKGTEPGPGGTIAILPATAKIIRINDLEKIKRDMNSVSGGIATALKDPSLPKDWRNARTGTAAEQLAELIQDNLYRSVPEGDSRWETTGGKVISELVSAVRNASNPEERAQALDALRYFVQGTSGLLQNYLAPLLGYDAIRANSGVMLVMNRGALIEYGGVGGTTMTDGLEQAVRNNSRMDPALVKKINRGERVD